MCEQLVALSDETLCQKLLPTASFQVHAACTNGIMCLVTHSTGGEEMRGTTDHALFIEFIHVS